MIVASRCGGSLIYDAPRSILAIRGVLLPILVDGGGMFVGFEVAE